MRRRSMHGVSVARAMGRSQGSGQASGDSQYKDVPAALNGLMEQLAAGLGRLCAAAEQHASRAGAVPREGNQNAANSRIVFGYNVRIGTAGFSAEPFGDLPMPTPARPAEPATRQPIVDVFDDGIAFLVVAELPGVNAGDVRCHVDGTTLLIEASGARPYSKRVSLPSAPLSESIELSCRNGILEVRLPYGPAAT